MAAEEMQSASVKWWQGPGDLKAGYVGSKVGPLAQLFNDPTLEHYLTAITLQSQRVRHISALYGRLCLRSDVISSIMTLLSPPHSGGYPLSSYAAQPRPDSSPPPSPWPHPSRGGPGVCMYLRRPSPITQRVGRQPAKGTPSTKPPKQKKKEQKIG